MNALRIARQSRGWSQRELASRAGLSFRGYQLLERPHHNARLRSLEKAATALGLPPIGARLAIEQFLSLPPESIRAAGLRILADRVPSWTVHLFDFVDAFRRAPNPELVQEPPPHLGSERLDALVAGTVEALCAEAGLPDPNWCQTIPALQQPWFVADIDNLKASALVESPVPFRRRNVFVLENFLARA